jgi:hypothetical protein
MTNNYSTVKNNLASAKIILVRMKPARYITASLANTSGKTWGMTFPFDNCPALTVDGLAYTKEYTGTPADREFYFNETTKQVLINLTTDETIGGGGVLTNIVIANYYLFYTNDIGRYLSEDPEDSSTNLRYWEPRVIGIPSFELSQDSIIDGFFTIGSTSLKLKNGDDNFQQYLSDDDSFNRKEVKIWHCLNKAENIKKFYFGFTVKLSLDNSSVTITIDDAFSALKNKYLCNTTSTGSTFNNSNFTVESTEKDKPILKLFSYSSKTSTVDNFSEKYTVAQHITLQPVQDYYIFTDAWKATNVSYNSTRSTSNNRTWACCKTINSTIDINVASVAADGSLIKVGVLATLYFTPGDNIYITKGVNTYYRYYVIEVDATNGYIYLSGDIANIDTDCQLHIPAISVVQITVGNDASGKEVVIQCAYGIDYSLTVIDNILCIKFSTNFESTYEIAAYEIAAGLSPNADIKFRAYSIGDDLEPVHTGTHATAVKQILEFCGLTVNSASITQAKSDCLSNSEFTIPYWSESEVPTCQDILEKILKCTLGYLVLNDDFEIEYKIAQAPSSSTELGDNEIVEDSFSQEIDYADIYDTVVFFNDHISYIFNDRNKVKRFVKDTSANLVETPKTTYLHGVSSINYFQHVLTEDSVYRVRTNIAALLANRKLFLNLKTKGINFESLIGDDFKITSSKIIGSAGYKTAKILKINKSGIDTELRLSDLLGL